MTIQEIYELIKEKKEKSENVMENIYYNRNFQYEVYQLKGEIKAYEDVLCLIESSGVLDV